MIRKSKPLILSSQHGVMQHNVVLNASELSGSKPSARVVANRTSSAQTNWQLTSILALSIVLSGCTDQSSAPQEKASFKRKMTDQIGEFHPDAGQQVVKPDVKVSNPITGPLEAYDPIVQQLATLGIDHAVALFQAEEGRYPNSHEEFMTRIIKNNNIRLPGLPTGLEYQYDLDNHKLVIVKTATPAPAAN